VFRLAKLLTLSHVLRTYRYLLYYIYDLCRIYISIHLYLCVFITRRAAAELHLAAARRAAR